MISKDENVTEFSGSALSESDALKLNIAYGCDAEGQNKGQCGGNISGEDGIIDSPPVDFPFPVAGKQTCEWIITVDTDSVIEITFEELNVTHFLKPFTTCLSNTLQTVLAGFSKFSFLTNWTSVIKIFFTPCKFGFKASLSPSREIR